MNSDCGMLEPSKGRWDANIIESKTQIIRCEGKVIVSTFDSKLAESDAVNLNVLVRNSHITSISGINESIDSEAHLRIPFSGDTSLENIFRDKFLRKQEICTIEYRVEGMSTVKFSGVVSRIYRDESSGYIDIDFSGVHLELC